MRKTFRGHWCTFRCIWPMLLCTKFPVKNFTTELRKKIENSVLNKFTDLCWTLCTATLGSLKAAGWGLDTLTVHKTSRRLSALGLLFWWQAYCDGHREKGAGHLVTVVCFSQLSLTSARVFLPSAALAAHTPAHTPPTAAHFSCHTVLCSGLENILGNFTDTLSRAIYKLLSSNRRYLWLGFDCISCRLPCLNFLNFM